ncbi:MAG: aminodeoxychorismate synthase component I [Isosphaeraceae bacterium]
MTLRSRKVLDTRSTLLGVIDDPNPELLAAKVGRMREPALLESGPGFGASGRYSFLTAHPRAVFEATDERWTLRETSRSTEGEGDPLEALEVWLDRLGLGGFDFDDPRSDDRPEPPFTGGLIGFFGYDLAPRLEKLPRKAARDSHVPDIRFALYDTVVVLDRADHSATLWTRNFDGEGPTESARRLDVWRARLDRPIEPSVGSRLSAPTSNFTREGYLEAVRRALDYIAAGDVFQINLSQRFEARGFVDPFDLYLRLKARSPAPFAAFLAWDDFAVISSSPESFVQTQGDRIVTRPIKGTRPRGNNEAEDDRLRAELLASEKDRAELTMIVDLERNDLGRVCEYGTVKVTDALKIESYAHVHHLVATVEGRARTGLSRIDLIRAMFPGGSITGAPKIRAMEIIDELEPTRRGLYTGAIGYFGHGTSAFNIAIRSMVVEGNLVRFQVGGGIVIDSVPEAEHEETLHKARGLLEAIEGWGARP